MSLSHSTSQLHLDVHAPNIPILLTRNLRCYALLKATYSSLQQICPASPPPAASRMSQLEGSRFTVQEEASQGLWGTSQESQAVALKSCLLAGPETHQTRKERGLGSRPTFASFASSKPCPCDLPTSGLPKGAASCHFQGMSSSPGHTGSTQPLHSCPFLTLFYFRSLGFCSSFIHSANHY